MMDSHYMQVALQLAQRAASEGEVPVGAIVVDNAGAIIGRGFDRRESLQDPTAHAEVLALREAARRTQSWRLPSCTLYVTLEPCTMCMGAVLGARIQWLVYGAPSPKSGAVESVLELAQVPRLNHRVSVRSGVLAEECKAVLQSFFAELRQ